jgi:putative hemolysin
LFDDVAMRAVGCFYTESEFDLTALKRSGRRLLELGRSCLHPDHRGGSAMYLLWNALAEYVLANKIEILFGTASFHGTDVEDLKAPLSLLHHRHLAPHALRVAAIGPTARPMDLVPMDQIDRRAAMVAIPALIKAYLRLGGCVGEGAFIDYDFNTTDVCLIMDTAALNVRQRDIYMKARR